jgi:hypothetical protein
MADFAPQTSLTSELISAGLNPNNPSQTSTDFGNTVASNILNAQQKQASIESTQAGTASTQAQTMTPEQAGATVKLMLQEKGIQFNPADIDSWVATLGDQEVPANLVESFANRYSGEKTRTALPAMFTTSHEIIIPSGMSAKDLGLENEESSDGKSVDDGTTSDGTFHAFVPEDGMYSVMYDNQGNILKIIPAGKEPAANTSGGPSEKSNEFWTNQWKTRIANKISPYLASTRTQVGVAIQAFVRCERALQVLNKPPVTKQDATNVIIEIGAVFKGGSPDNAAILNTVYNSVYGDFQDWTQSILGKVHNALPDNIRQHLVMRIQDLENQSKKVVDDSISSAEALNSDVIAHFPDQWQAYLAEINKELQDTNNPAPVTPATGATFTPPTGPVSGVLTTPNPTAVQTGTPSLQSLIDRYK